MKQVVLCRHPAEYCQYVKVHVKTLTLVLLQQYNNTKTNNKTMKTELYMVSYLTCLSQAHAHSEACRHAWRKGNWQRIAQACINHPDTSDHSLYYQLTVEMFDTLYVISHLSVEGNHMGRNSKKTENRNIASCSSFDIHTFQVHLTVLLHNSSVRIIIHMWIHINRRKNTSSLNRFLWVCVTSMHFFLSSCKH